MICVRPLCRMTVRSSKNCNVKISWGNVNIKNVRLCMMVLFVKLYPFIPLSVTLITFLGHSGIKTVVQI